MEERNPPTPDTPKRKPYVAPAIAFEHPTEALAGSCTQGSQVCPSKQIGATLCDSFEECTSNNS